MGNYYVLLLYNSFFFLLPTNDISITPTFYTYFKYLDKPTEGLDFLFIEGQKHNFKRLLNLKAKFRYVDKRVIKMWFMKSIYIISSV